MTTRLPLNWRTLYILGWTAIGTNLLAVLAGFLLLIAHGQPPESNSTPLFFALMFLLPSFYLYAYGVVTVWKCSPEGLSIRNLVGKSRHVAWEKIQAVEQRGSRMRLVVEDEEPIIFPQAFDGYTVILYWLDRLSPTTAPVLEPSTPKVPKSETTVFGQSPKSLVALYVAGTSAAAVLIIGITSLIEPSRSLLVGEGMAFALLAVGVVVGSSRHRWVVENGELRIYPLIGPTRHFDLMRLRRISREADFDGRDDLREDWVLHFTDGSLYLPAGRQWSREFIGAVLREAPRAEVIDYTEDSFSIRTSVILI